MGFGLQSYLDEELLVNKKKLKSHAMRCLLEESNVPEIVRKVMRKWLQILVKDSCQ